jgi:hypothetical protein
VLSQAEVRRILQCVDHHDLHPRHEEAGGGWGAQSTGGIVIGLRDGRSHVVADGECNRALEREKAAALGLAVGGRPLRATPCP